MANSAALKQELGDVEAVILVQRHRAAVRELLSRFDKKLSQRVKSRQLYDHRISSVTVLAQHDG